MALVADYAVTIAVAFGAGWSLTGSSLVGLAAGVAVFGFLFRPRSAKRAYEGMDVNYMGERELAAIVGNVELAGGSAVAHVTDKARSARFTCIPCAWMTGSPLVAAEWAVRVSACRIGGATLRVSLSASW